MQGAGFLERRRAHPAFRASRQLLDLKTCTVFSCFSGCRFTHPSVATWVIPKEVEVRKLALGNNLEEEIVCL